ncbi:MAG: hypothetical protein ABI777_05820 [Betaproteobacteria bacterium]
MESLVSIFVRYVLHLLGVLIVVILLLLAGNWIISEWRAWDGAALELDRLRATGTDVASRQASMRQAVLARIPKPNAPIEAITQQKMQMEQEIGALKAKRSQLQSQNPINRFVPGSSAFRDGLLLDVEIALGQQALAYTTNLYDLVLKLRSREQQLAVANAEMLAVSAKIYQRLDELSALERSAGLRLMIPFSDLRARKTRLGEELVELTATQARATAKFQELQTPIASRASFPLFEIQNEPIAKILLPLEGRIAELDRKLDASTMHKVVKPLLDVLPTAAWIVFGIIVAPFGIKFFAFFVVAPIAARRPAICLLPDANGSLSVRHSTRVGTSGRYTSGVSQSLVLAADQELLAHSTYIQSVASLASKRTKWLLDWSMPFTSLASHLYALTQVTPAGAEPIVLSSTGDPLSEIAILDLPAGAAIVLQPRCLVGIVKQQHEPVRITRHWRLGHVSAWLTLQLRYIVFHGPLLLVVRGCRGIRVEPVNEGRAINQAATLGFSANLRYSTSRCETFGSYLIGAQELFNDRFAGQPGYCIYEEVPRAGFKGGIAGRGIEGVLDTVLKVVGI